MLDAQQLRLVAAEAMCTERTAKAVYSPQNAPRKPQPSSVLRVRRAAEKLGLPLPPQHEPATNNA